VYDSRRLLLLPLPQAQPDKQGKERASIIICHSLPTNWVGAAWAGEPCPPDARDHGYVYLVGRTMFETDRLPEAFVPRWALHGGMLATPPAGQA
jgi:hypothetical protein